LKASFPPTFHAQFERLQQFRHPRRYLLINFTTSQYQCITISQLVWYSIYQGGEMRRAIPKTHQALDWIGKGLTAAQAARKMEISESSVYAAIRKTRAKDLGCCPTCGQKIRK
jgi:hypothetical protein